MTIVSKTYFSKHLSNLSIPFYSQQQSAIMWLAMDNTIGFFAGTFVILLYLFMGGYLKLYLKAKMKLKTILIISAAMFVLLESVWIYHIFWRQK